MRKLLKWGAWVLGGLVVIVLVAVTAGYQLADMKMARHIDVNVQAVAYTSEPAAVARGKYLFESRGCTDCHGANGGGKLFVDKPDIKLGGPDITSSGVTSAYQPVDWVRTIRHGVKPAGQPLMVMPSEDYNRLTDADLASLVAYVRSLPPAKGGKAVIDLPPPVRVLYGFGAIKDAAAKIDHTLPPAQPVAEAADAKHGAYVANMCLGCHGEHLSGGKIPGGPPDWPAAANLTPGEGSVMPRYPDAAKFVAMFRSGKRPDGSAIQVMPFGSLSKMSDVDAQAVYAFLKTVPARPAGGR